VTRGRLPQRAELPVLNGGGTAAAVPELFYFCSRFQLNAYNYYFSASHGPPKSLPQL